MTVQPLAPEHIPFTHTIVPDRRHSILKAPPGDNPKKYEPLISVAPPNVKLLNWTWIEVSIIKSIVLLFSFLKTCDVSTLNCQTGHFELF